MKNDITQNTDIRGLQFLKDTKIDYSYSEKTLDELEKISKPIGKVNMQALELFKKEYKKLNKLPFEITPQEKHYLEKNKKETHFGYLVYRYEFKIFPKKKIDTDFPCYVLIEPVSSCNLKCGMCFQSDNTFIKKEFMGKMDMELYKKIIDECCKEGTKAITFGSRGEPTIHQNFKEFIDYANNKFMDLKIITNATKLDDELIHKIFQSNISQVVFSIDSEKKQEYEEIRKFGKYDEVLQNVKNYNKIKKEYKNCKTTTRISGVKVRDSQDPKSFSSFWSEYADEVVMKPAYPRWNTYINEKMDELTKPCEYWWERMYVWFDGKVNPCDADYKSYLSYGNVKENTIKDIWNSNKLKNYREQHLSGNRGNITPCDRCGLA